jgi:broad specificity phosphatase PhoE
MPDAPQALPADLILIKHSQPAIVPGVPAAEWVLSDEGRQRCVPLAAALAAYAPGALVSSEEPKAVETAHLVAVRLGLPHSAAPGLHEHVRRSAAYTAPAEFHASVAALFAHPSELVYGDETADEAHVRFVAAVAGIMGDAAQSRPGRAVAIVAHGTVISLFVARATGIDPFNLWVRLGLPSFVALSWPCVGVLSIVENVPPTV